MSEALLGVIIGGLLTLIPAVIIEIKKSRIEGQKRADQVRSIARVLEDNLWVGEVLMCSALSSGQWWRAARNPLHTLTAEEMRIVAASVDMTTWGIIAGATRHFNEWGQVARDLGPLTKVNSDDRVRLIRSLVLAEEARLRLGALTGVQRNPVDFSRILDDDRMLSEAAERMLPRPLNAHRDWSVRRPRGDSFPMEPEVATRRSRRRRWPL